jgi:hypothetical protein
MNATYTASVASDLFNAGRTEDGTPFIAEVYFVEIENAAGRRFRHDATFSGVEVLVDEYEGGNYFVDRREEAAAKAECLTARVNAALKTGRGVDMDLWQEVDPAYGSDAYISQGTEAKRAYADRFAD